MRRSDAIVVAVPAGVADGARLRVASGGNAGTAGGPPGDVYVTVRVEEHPLFRREGDDLHLIVPVAVHEAVLGARVEIPVLDGTARLRVPPGTQTGQRIRLRGRGAPSPRDGRRGDLVAEIRVTLATGARRAIEGTAEAIRRDQRARERAGAVRAVPGA